MKPDLIARLKNLLDGTNEPLNGMEKHFLKVVKGNGLACTPELKEWLKWWKESFDPYLVDKNISTQIPEQNLLKDVPFQKIVKKKKAKKKTVGLSAAQAKKSAEKNRKPNHDPRSIFITDDVRIKVVSGGLPSLGRHR
jgi:hypothetical protein